MNILTKSVMEHTDTQYNEYGDKVKEMQQSIDFDLKEYKDVNEKVIRLDSLGKTCDILMDKAKDQKENNIICKMVSLVKLCIIAISLYSAFTKISPEITNGSLSSNSINNIIVYLVVCVVTIFVVTLLAKGTNEIIKNLYDEKITQLSLKKAVIESNYKQLSKESSSSSNNDIVENKNENEQVVK